jgi:hypothetical protein
MGIRRGCAGKWSSFSNSFGVCKIEKKKSEDGGVLKLSTQYFLGFMAMHE